MNGNLKTILSDLFDIAIKVAANSTLTLYPSKSSDQEFLAQLFCLNRGNYNYDTKLSPHSQHCACDIGFFGNSCQTTGLDYWGRGWTSIQVLFTMAYCIITIIMWVYFKRSIEKVTLIKNRNLVTFGEYCLD